MKNEVWVPVVGTVVNWTTERQVNPETGETFDFEGRLVIPDEPLAKTKKNPSTTKDKP